MPLYELSLIVRKGLHKGNTKDLLVKTSRTIWSHKGIVRNLANFGEGELPHPMKRHQTYFSEGSFWTIQFDANPFTLTDLNSKLKVDPRVIRHNVIKLGDNIQQIAPKVDVQDEL